MLSSYALTLFCCHQCIFWENSCLLWQEMGLMAVKTPAWKAAAWKIKSLWVRHYRRPLVCAIVNIIIAKASTWDTTKQRGNRKWDLRVGQCGNIWLLPRDPNSRSYIRAVGLLNKTQNKTTKNTLEHFQLPTSSAWRRVRCISFAQPVFNALRFLLHIFHFQMRYMTLRVFFFF